LKVRILKSFDNYKTDQVVNINLDLFWRKRLRDGDAEIAKDVKPKKAKSEE
jgi:hypothetical protein